MWQSRSVEESESESAAPVKAWPLAALELQWALRLESAAVEMALACWSEMESRSVFPPMFARRS